MGIEGYEMCFLKPNLSDESGLMLYQESFLAKASVVRLE